MKNKVFLLTFFFLMIGVPFNWAGEGASVSQDPVQEIVDMDSLRNPFLSQLPKIIAPVVEEIGRQQESFFDSQTSPSQEIQRVRKWPELNITGVIWNTDHPQVIINGQVLQVGDNITFEDKEVVRGPSQEINQKKENKKIEIPIVSIKKNEIEVTFDGETKVIKP